MRLTLSALGQYLCRDRRALPPGTQHLPESPCIKCFEVVELLQLDV